MFNPKEHMTDLRGRDYLEVKWRVVWFREMHPGGRIDTEIANLDPLIVRARVFADEAAGGVLLATGHGSANAGGRKVVWTGREIEKAETAAIGRALAHAGFGTQFTAEDEGDHLADSPVESTPAPAPAPERKFSPAVLSAVMRVDDRITNPGQAAALLELSDPDLIPNGVSTKRAVFWAEAYQSARADGNESAEAAAAADYATASEIERQAAS